MASFSTLSYRFLRVFNLFTRFFFFFLLGFHASWLFLIGFSSARAVFHAARRAA